MYGLLQLHLSVQTTMALIQNIDICVNSTISRIAEHDTSIDLLASFSGTDVPRRKTCVLRLKGIHPAINLHYVAFMLRTMSGLVNFERVYVTAMTGKLVRMDGPPVNVYDVDEERYYPLTRARNTPAYKLAKKELKATLGPSIWHDGKKEAGRYLEFRPLEYRKRP